MIITPQTSSLPSVPISLSFLKTEGQPADPIGVARRRGALLGPFALYASGDMRAPCLQGRGCSGKEEQDSAAEGRGPQEGRYPRSGGAHSRQRARAPAGCQSKVQRAPCMPLPDGPREIRHPFHSVPQPERGELTLMVMLQEPFSLQPTIAFQADKALNAPDGWRLRQHFLLESRFLLSGALGLFRRPSG